MTAPAKSPDVTILVVSYNTKALTLKCLASVQEQTKYVTYQVRVWDNASADGSVAAIRAAHPDVDVIASSENLGFGVACNRLAEDVKSPYILLLNPDTEILDGAIDRLVRFAKQRPAHGLWGGRMFYPDGSPNLFSCFADMSLWNQFCRASGLAAIFRNSAFFNAEEYGGWDRGTVREVDNITGGFLLVSTQVWRAVGGFDERFFMYGEEADLHWRARKAGWQPIVTPEAKIVHVSGASEAVRADKMVRLLRAKRELITLHWPQWQQPLGAALLKGWALTRTVAAHAKGRFVKGAAASNAWPEIYARRSEWLAGYMSSE